MREGCPSYMYEIHLKVKSVLKEEITFPVVASFEWVNKRFLYSPVYKVDGHPTNISLKRKSSRIDMSKVHECYTVAWFSCSAGLKEINDAKSFEVKMEIEMR